MNEKRSSAAAQAVTTEKAPSAQAGSEPKRKISAVWMSNDPSQNAVHDCVKCSSRSSSH